MPPKKDAKKDAVIRPDNSGIPKNGVEFKFEFAVRMMPDSPTYAIMFEWFGATSEKIERYDTGFIDSWTKSTTCTTIVTQRPKKLCLRDSSIPFKSTMYSMTYIGFL
jgi:hypothetical protein